MPLLAKGPSRGVFNLCSSCTFVIFAGESHPDSWCKQVHPHLCLSVCLRSHLYESLTGQSSWCSHKEYFLEESDRASTQMPGKFSVREQWRNSLAGWFCSVSCHVVAQGRLEAASLLESQACSTPLSCTVIFFFVFWHSSKHTIVWLSSKHTGVLYSGDCLLANSENCSQSSWRLTMWGLSADDTLGRFAGQDFSSM